MGSQDAVLGSQVLVLQATILYAAGIPPDLAYKIEKRPVFVTKDGKAKPAGSIRLNPVCEPPGFGSVTGVMIWAGERAGRQKALTELADCRHVS